MPIVTRNTVLAFTLTVGAGTAAAAQTDPGNGGEPVDLTTWSYGPLHKGGWSAEALLDAEAYDVVAQEIGEVEDIIVAADGRIDRLVIEAGGVLDIDGTHFGVPWAEPEIVHLDYATVPVDEGNVDGFSIFRDLEGDEPAGRAWHVTELIGDDATLADGRRYGVVDDLVFDAEGRLQAVVIAPAGGFDRVGPDAVPFYGYPYGWNPAGPAYPARFTAEELGRLDPFEVARLAETGQTEEEPFE